MIRIYDLETNQYVSKIVFPQSIIITENEINVIEVIRNYRIEIRDESFSNLVMCIENENYRGAGVWIKKSNQNIWNKCLTIGSVINSADIDIDIKLSVINHKLLVKANKYTFKISFYNYD